MNTSNDLQNVSTSEQENDKSRWTSGPIISRHEGKCFNRSGETMKVLEMRTYVLEVFPPEQLAIHMQQPSPDIVDHLEHKGIDIHHLNKRDVSFFAHVSLPYAPEDSAVEISLTSNQRQEGGVYKHEISLPRHMLCVRESPVDTVLDSLNNALDQYNWYPPY